MSLAIVHSRAQTGLDAPPVTVEVDLSSGMPAMTMVGLPEAAVKESKDRVRSAIINSGFEFPFRRLTINLAPADLPKEGGRFDLAIALGILAASGQIPDRRLADFEFLGELSLTGQLRGVRGSLPAALAIKKAKRQLIVAQENGAQAALAGRDHVLVAGNLTDVAAAMDAKYQLPQPRLPKAVKPVFSADLADVRGQAQAKRALEIAAAGGHSMLMIGPPGSGKTMLASRLPSILPPLTEQQALEVATVGSISNQGFQACDWGQRPFRAPHHTASGVALVGGGSKPRPGEITLAHGGVLFLDELPEFARSVLEVLREPLESKHIIISRAANQAQFPANFQLIAAMNPCPCGYQGDPSGRCHCTPERIDRYRGKISGPLLDRIDMHLYVAPVEQAQLMSATATAEASACVQKRVVAARDYAKKRGHAYNAAIAVGEIDRLCPLEPAAKVLLSQAMVRLNISARAYHRILRIARTIADLAGSQAIAAAHVAEALGFRQLDRQSSL